MIISINPWFRPILYVAFIVIVCMIMQGLTPSRSDMPVKEIYYSTLKEQSEYQLSDSLKELSMSARVKRIDTTPEKNKEDSMTLANLALDFLRQKRHKSENPVIRYYTKVLDGSAVYQLDKYGFYVHERKTNHLQNFKSNVIHFGDSVTMDEIQIIAYVMISGGLDIKEIAPSRYHAGWKYNSVEVGADTTLLNNPSISYTDLNNLKLEK